MEAIVHAQKELAKLQASDATEESEAIVDFEEKKRRHNKKLKLKKGQSETDPNYQHSENPRDF